MERQMKEVEKRNDIARLRKAKIKSQRLARR